MGEGTKIEWAHHTFNPWWGCVKVSEACRNCYAEAWAKRTGHGGTWGASGRRRFFSDKHWAEPLKWNRKAQEAGERHRVFCASMCDVCEFLPVDHPSASDMSYARHRLFRLIEDTQDGLDWLLLTKRPENLLRMKQAAWYASLPNVWVGTTVEDQATAKARIPHLLRVPAPVRFLSCEPLLEGVRLHDDWTGAAMRRQAVAEGKLGYAGNFLQWVIVGGESGGGSRDFDIAWAYDLIEQCRTVGTAVFVKQLGARPIMTRTGPDPSSTLVSVGTDGVARLRLDNSKGGNPNEWPVDLRIRELPRRNHHVERDWLGKNPTTET